jgi:hypothetical protein
MISTLGPAKDIQQQIVGRGVASRVLFIFLFTAGFSQVT